MKRGIAALACALLLAGCAQDGVISPAGPTAAAQLDHLLFIIAMVSVVAVPVFFFLPWVLWRYRFGKDSDYRPDWTFSWPLEIGVWGIPAVIVAVLSWQAWHETHKLDPYRPIGSEAPLRVQVIGLDWKWLFIYPEQGIATVDELVIPRDRDIALELTADGPMVSFMVPRLGSQVYAMAGMTTQLHLLADRTGTFRGLNTQYNGSGFPDQHFAVRSLAPRQFEAWANQAKGNASLGTMQYRRLEQRSVIDQPLAFGSVEPALFETVLAKYAHAMPAMTGHTR